MQDCSEIEAVSASVILQKMKKELTVHFYISVLLFVLIFCIALMLGSFNVSFVSFFKAVFTKDMTLDVERAIINLRFPRTAIAALAGVSLSLSGLLFQEIFQNELVSPDLLGVSAGSGTGAAMAIILNAPPAAISLSAFVAGTAAVSLTLVFSRVFRSNSSVTLLLSGIIVGGFMNGLLSMCKYFANAETTLASITYWLMGSFAYTKMKDVFALLPVVMVCSLFVFCIRWKINVVALGREEAQTKGVNYVFYRTLFVLIATLLTASTVSFCGTIGWVGLVVPHIVRFITGKNTANSVPFTIILGGTFMVLTDIFSRSFTTDEIPLSAVTGLLGTLVFAAILFHNRRKYHEFWN